MNINKVKGMVFKSPINGDEYGTIRISDSQNCPDWFPSDIWTPVADDDCGNIFAINKVGQVGWWDHETEKITILTNSLDEFCENCSEPKDIELDPSRIIKVWVNPNFKPKF